MMLSMDDKAGLPWPVKCQTEIGTEHPYAGMAYLLAAWWLTQAAAGDVPSGGIAELMAVDNNTHNELN